MMRLRTPRFSSRRALVAGLLTLSPLASLASGALAQGQTPPTATAAPQASLPAYKDEIDTSVRWLRSTHDLASGAYGGGVDGTAWVLYALATCPRKYQAGDGPFVARALDYLLARQADDGSIASEGADDAKRLAETSRAAAALSVHVTEHTGPALGRAVAWLSARGVTEPDLGLPREVTADKAKALAESVALLRSRSEEGSWDGPDGKVVTTARNVVWLTRYAKVVEPKAPKPTSARPLPAFSAAAAAEVDASILAGARFLLRQSVGGAEARWGAPGKPDAGITAMVAGALQAVPEPRPADIEAAIVDALAWLVSLQMEDGSIHQGPLANYVTSASVLALARRPGNEARLARARDYLVRLQSDEGEGYGADHAYYGGVGYGGDERPDLSNLQMALEALAASGLDQDDPAWDRALVFLQRCQNRSETNDLTLQKGGVTIKSGNDGGGAYAPGESKAGMMKLPDGSEIPRSYGSMSYALLKGYVFAGLAKDDPRVQALWTWLQANYTLDLNPGFVVSDDPTAPYQGLFYYFHTMAKALDLFGEEDIVDGAGTTRAWRSELAGRLVAMQSKGDGSWVNTNAPIWWEGNPVLATSYALLALELTRPKSK